MKTIHLLDMKFTIEKEFEMAVCIWETWASNTETYERVDIAFGQRVHNVKILNTGSIIFTIEPESNVYMVTTFPQMFGLPTEEDVKKIENLKEAIKKHQMEINAIFDRIEKTGYTEIP